MNTAFPFRVLNAAPAPQPLFPTLIYGRAGGALWLLAAIAIAALTLTPALAVLILNA